jgi:ATPase subunit of ABC transporter with duplicated ATPase domains
MSTASISVVNLRWSTPDGQPLFNNLNLGFGPERTGLVGRNGVGKSTLLKLISGELEPTVGRISTRGKIATLRQTVQTRPGEIVADLLGARIGFTLLRKADAGTATIEELADVDWTLETRATAALAQVGLNVPLDAPLAKLSGGQRTRAAVAGAVFARPDLLLLDEPTNNLDRDGRLAVRQLLEGWRAGAIVVSHDRELLETMDAIVELTSLGGSRYGGNWSNYQARKEIELASAEHDLANAERRLVEISRKAQQSIERKQRRDAAGVRKSARGDMPRILAGARRDRAEKTGGVDARLADRQRESSEHAREEARGRIERIEPLRVELEPSGLITGRRVLDVDHVNFGYSREVPVLRDVLLSLVGPERVAISGPNGSGKSTLLEIIAGLRLPWSGCARIHVSFALFDQSLSMLDPGETIAMNYSRLNPGVDDNIIRASLARFQFRAEAADRFVGTLSGGQSLRAGLACVLGAPPMPQLLILDEPTNHLDLDSVAALEGALRAYDGALLVVSHDAAFLDAIAIERRLELGA